MLITGSGGIGLLLLDRPGQIWLATVGLMAPFAFLAIWHAGDTNFNPLSELWTDAPSVAGTRALQLPDTQVKSDFLASFGRPARNICDAGERSADPTIAQALHVINGDTLNRKIAATIEAMSSPSPVVNQTEPCRPIRLVINQKALSGSVSITAPTVAARPPRRKANNGRMKAAAFAPGGRQSSELSMP